jgi:HEPN domain-containing protein
LGDIRGLVTDALKDMDLAKRRMHSREYATATLLYGKAIEKVLTALYMSRERRDPPAGASAAYMAKKAGMPEEVVTDLLSLQEEEEEIIESENEREIRGYEEIVRSARAERKVLQMDEIATKLVDYTMSYAKA